MPKEKIKATKLTVGLPFDLGSLQFENDDSQQKAAWSMYVELSTRIAAQPLHEDDGMLREALTSLYNVFGITRQILREAGPDVAKGPNSLGFVAIEVLNKGLRPFLTKWHSLLKAYEESKPAKVSALTHERAWDRAAELRRELEAVRGQMLIYIEALATIAGIK